MKKLKRIYIVVIVLIALLTISLCASFAFFVNKSEHHGKLNIVVGNLTYRIDSNFLEDNSITIGANEIKEITLSLYSLNNISSKYELYYTLDKPNSNLKVGYSVDTKDDVLGTIDANSKKEITIMILNESNTSATISFSVIGGLVNNELALTEGNSLNQAINKYSITNLVTNGSFEDNGTGFYHHEYSQVVEGITGSITSNVAKFGSNSLYIIDTSDSTGYWNYQVVDTNSNVGDKYYLSLYHRSVSGIFTGLLNTPDAPSLSELIITSSNSNAWQRGSNIYTVTESGDVTLQIGSSIAGVFNGTVDGIFVINLTETFGKDNEPDKEWCDNHLDYFEGTMIVYK